MPTPAPTPKPTPMPTPAPTPKPTPMPTLAPVAVRNENATKALLVSRASADLEIVGCDASSVEIKGIRAAEVFPGMLFININADFTCSELCSPLLRKVTGITTLLSGVRVLDTIDATFADILGSKLIKDEFMNSSAESASGCFFPESVSESGSCSRRWLQKNADGRCTHTNCFVGTSGNPKNCFECQRGCDDHCGARDSILTEHGHRLLSSFRSACCNHDRCWSSNSHSKDDCDERLYQSMQAECPTLPPVVSLGLNFTGPLKAVLGQCDIVAFLFVSAIAFDPFDAYVSAQLKQKVYESSAVCAVPTVPRSTLAPIAPTPAPVAPKPTKAPHHGGKGGGHTPAPITRRSTSAPIAPTPAPVTPKPTKAPNHQGQGKGHTPAPVAHGPM